MPRPNEILQDAIKTLVQRGHEYDAAGEERSMAKVVEIFNAITDNDLTETEGWTFMLALKLARMTRGKSKLDTFVDLSAYAALLGEHMLDTKSKEPAP